MKIVLISYRDDNPLEGQEEVTEVELSPKSMTGYGTSFISIKMGNMVACVKADELKKVIGAL